MEPAHVKMLVYFGMHVRGKRFGQPFILVTITNEPLHHKPNDLTIPWLIFDKFSVIWVEYANANKRKILFHLFYLYGSKK